MAEQPRPRILFIQRPAVSGNLVLPNSNTSGLRPVMTASCPANRLAAAGAKYGLRTLPMTGGQHIPIPSLSQISTLNSREVYKPGDSFYNRGSFERPETTTQSETTTQPGTPTSISNSDAFDQYYDDSQQSDDDDTVMSRNGSRKRTRSLDEQRFDRELIDHVREHRVLWDPKDDKHKDNSYCERIWRRIASSIDGKLPWHDCKKRWQEMRKYFCKIRNKLPPSGSSYQEERDKVKWPLYKSMEFINDTLKHGRTDSSWEAPVSVSSQLLHTPTPISEADQYPIDESPTTDYTPPTASGKKRIRKRAAGSYDDGSDNALAEAFKTASSNMASAFAASARASDPPNQPMDANAALCNLIAKELTAFSPQQQQKMRTRLMRCLLDLIDDPPE